MTVTRRTVLKTGAALGAAAATSLAAPVFAQAKTKIKLGYLHTLAVDGQIWTGIDRGSFAKHGVEFELTQFNTGLELFQAMIGGSIDMLSTGAVISNFPARGQGIMFLCNDIEFATAQLWVRDDIKSFADLKGKKIATTTGTTAHVFLDKALAANGLGNAGDVEIVNQRMPDAVTAFISGAVPAVALWVPFNVQVKAKLPTAHMLVDASKFFPEAAIVDGWAAGNAWYAKNRAVCANVIRGWAEANDYMIQNPDAALGALQKAHYPNVSIEELKSQFAAQKMFTSVEWRPKYADGTVTRWLQQVSDFFVRFGKIENAVPASKYFDASLYLETIKG